MKSLKELFQAIFKGEDRLSPEDFQPLIIAIVIVATAMSLVVSLLTARYKLFLTLVLLLLLSYKYREIKEYVKKIFLNESNLYPTPGCVLEIVFPLFQYLSNILYRSMTSFGFLFYDKLQGQNSDETLRSPRATIDLKWANGIPIYDVHFLKQAPSVIEAKALKSESLLLRQIIGNTIDNGAFLPANVQPRFCGLPVLYLLDIKDQGTELVFQFIWISTEAAANYVYKNGSGSGSIDPKDEDF